MKPRIKEVQALRGIALLAVLLFHSSTTAFENGFLGVDVFFVISGYVIAPRLYEVLNAQNFKKELYRFYLRRVYRLFPALYVTIFLSLPLILFLGNVRDLAVFWNQSISSLLFFGNIMPIFSEISYHDQGVNPYLHTWSLAVEFQIYLILPILLLLIIKRVGYRAILFFLSLTSLSVFILFEYFFHQSGNQVFGNLAFYLPVTRFWEFGLGALLSTFRIAQRESSLKIVFLRSALYLLFGLILFTNLFELSSHTSLIIVLFISILFLLTSSDSKNVASIINVLAWLGDRSYSIYLVHLPLIYLAKYSPEFINLSTSSVRSVLAIALSFALGVTLYDKVENKNRKIFLNYSSYRFYLRDALIITSVLAITFIPFVLVNKTSYPVDPLDSITTVRNTEWDNECKLEFRKDPCLYNEGQDNTLLLIGDSHAAMFGKTIVGIGLEKKITVYIWATPACQFFIPEPEWLKAHEIDACVENNLLRNSWIRENKPDQILYSFIDSNLNANKYSETRHAFRMNILNTLKNSATFTKHAVFILPTPKLPDFSLLEFLKSNRQFALPTEYFREVSFWRSELGSFKFRIVDTQNELCPNSFCRPIILGKKIWEDTTHISYLGSNLVRGEILESIVHE